MPITKLSAPQPHELVRKVNELVDALTLPMTEVRGFLGR
jgi:hypothetical protein